jgi:hypothetical protein
MNVWTKTQASVAASLHAQDFFVVSTKLFMAVFHEGRVREHRC